jgi:hypothetical protein
MKSQELLKTFFIIFGVMGFFYLSLLTTITYTDIYAYAQDENRPENDNTVSPWTTGAPLPTPRSEIAGAALNGKVYIIGGFDENG